MLADRPKWRQKCFISISFCNDIVLVFGNKRVFSEWDITIIINITTFTGNVNYIF